MYWHYIINWHVMSVNRFLNNQTTFINQTAFLKVFRRTWHWETSDLARSKNKDNFCVSCVHNKHSSSRMRGIPFNTLNVSYFWNVAFLNALFPTFQKSKRYHLRVLQVFLKSPRCFMSLPTQCSSMSSAHLSQPECGKFSAWSLPSAQQQIQKSSANSSTQK